MAVAVVGAQALADKIEAALRRASFVDHVSPTPAETGALTVWMKDGSKLTVLVLERLP